MDRERMRQSLKDAGCGDGEIDKMLAALDLGNRKQFDALVEQHRKALLQQYRYSRQCIDHIDYFSYQLAKEE